MTLLKKRPAQVITAKKSAPVDAQKDRQAMLSKIHIAKKQLNMDDDTYQAMLQNVIGTISCKDATITQLQKVIDYMSQHGAILINRKNYGRRPHNISSQSLQSTSDLLKKIEAQLAEAKLPWSYLTAKGKKGYSMLERVTGKQALEFCTSDELQKIIAALYYVVKRKEKKEHKDV